MGGGKIHHGECLLASSRLCDDWSAIRLELLKSWTCPDNSPGV